MVIMIFNITLGKFFRGCDSGGSREMILVVVEFGISFFMWFFRELGYGCFLGVFV